MKEEIVKLVSNNLDEFDLWIDDVIYEKEENNNYLRIILDSKNMISLDLVVSVTKIINSILDNNDISFLKGQYILDVYAKSKGDVKSE